MLNFILFYAQFYTILMQFNNTIYTTQFNAILYYFILFYSQFYTILYYFNAILYYFMLNFILLNLMQFYNIKLSIK